MAEPTARPILFKHEMVRAILEDRKTQTRRVVKPLPGAGWRTETATGDTLRLGMITSPHPKKGKFGLFMRREIHPGSGEYEHDLVPCPYGAPGDLLWCRETHYVPGGFLDEELIDEIRQGISTTADLGVTYRADTPSLVPFDGGWAPSIHMPRWASRLTLEISNVRVERLQDISEADAVAEGVEPEFLDGEIYATAKDAFSTLWESINGPGSWALDLLVWVVEFTAHEVNVDQFLKEHAHG